MKPSIAFRMLLDKVAKAGEGKDIHCCYGASPQSGVYSQAIRGKLYRKTRFEAHDSRTFCL
jgi:hypothetical protein